jgi:hypothetical protein
VAEIDRVVTIAFCRIDASRAATPDRTPPDRDAPVRQAVLRMADAIVANDRSPAQGSNNAAYATDAISQDIIGHGSVDAVVMQRAPDAAWASVAMSTGADQHNARRASAARAADGRRASDRRRQVRQWDSRPPRTSVTGFGSRGQ